ncbi:MAG TPA: phosphotransferase [Phenylobacterium sp.]|uniref:phosphotransferase enzyme family protein n=1 Tax=Phenylobacterium sp. TaxID=1871053 RepID=UPI002B476CC2|nr:phosphotransferase [Phenylobacterium sp.]HKR87122.1 phosphotransferase [Phenylobacterium sp.]
MPADGLPDFYAVSPAEQAERLTALARRALQRWPGAYADLKLVKHRENAVFSATRDDGRRIALRVHRHAYHSDEALRSELAWIGALADHGLQVPPVLPPAHGDLFTHVDCEGVPEPRQVDMLGWVEGVPIGSVEDGLQLDEADPVGLFRDIGALAAQLHQQAAAWSRPADFRRHAWDEDGLIGPQPFWGRFLDLPLLTASQRRLLETARDRAALDLADYGKAPSRYGLIHADFAPENLLRNERGLVLIDFDDCGYGWHMFELATVLFLRFGEGRYSAYVEAMFAGYDQVRRLPDADRRSLPLFLFLRGTTYLGWIQTRYETEFARELAPSFIGRVCDVAAAYLDGGA